MLYLPETESVVHGRLISLYDGFTIDLMHRDLLVGRHPCCHVVLNLRSLSRRHCRMSLRHGYWYIADLNSTNGVRVDGKRIDRKRLKPGSIVSLSKYKFQLQYEFPEHWG